MNLTKKQIPNFRHLERWIFIINDSHGFLQEKAENAETPSPGFKKLGDIQT